MSERLTLLTLLGVDTLADAAEIWPRTTLLPGLGLSGSIEQPGDHVPVIDYLNTVLRFAAVRPGSAGDTVGLIADVTIDPHPNRKPLVLRELPDIGFLLETNTAARPARVFVTQSDIGVEVIIEGLPVEISLPNGLLMPLRSEKDEEAGPSLTDVKQAGPFEPGVYDTFEVILRELTTSSIKTHLRFRFTEQRQVVIEPCVPISIGPCRFSGLPCRGVHDLGFLPYPTLTAPHTDHELPLEWSRHEIPGGLGTEGTGLITVRTIDLDHGRDPLKQVVNRFHGQDAGPGGPVPRPDVEFVLEDVALPVSSWLTPVATHGRFGLRRSVLQGDDTAEAYDLTLAPVELDLSGVVNWRLKIFRLLFETPSTVVARMAVLFGASEELDHAMVIDVSDSWVVEGAWLPPNPLHAFRVANVSVSMMTAKLGVLLQDIQNAQRSNVLDHFRALVDLGIKVGQDSPEPVKFTSPGKPPGVDLGQDVVLRGLGMDLGTKLAMPSLWFPETLKLQAFEVVQLEVEEVDFLNEDNGGRYLAFSGGVSIYPGAGKPVRTNEPGTPGVPANNSASGGGIRFRRLRFRTGGNPLAPNWLLDGVSVFIRAGRVELSGFGTITDSTRNAHRYQEFGFGLLLRFSAMDKDFQIGAQLYYGRVSGLTDNFSYWLFGFQLSYCPVGAIDMRGIRMLVAGGMSPDLPEPSGQPQEMRLLRWYQQFSASGAVEVRNDRAQQRGGWKAELNAQAAGVGADVCLSVSKALFLRAFIFLHQSDSGSGLLVSAEVFALKATQPIGVGAIEIDLDRDKVSAIIAVDLELAKLFNSESALIKGLGRLTGTVFAGNQPGMFAIGQLNDQTSWLTLSLNKSLLGLIARVSVAFCLQIAAGSGPRGFGLAASATAQGSMGIGKVQFYAAIGFLAGTWGNEASSSGIVAWAEVALRIKVFWVFSFGASVKAIFEQLGPQEPNYRRVSLEVRIETPWWLPDVTFRLERVRETPRPGDMPIISPPVSTAGALEPGSATETAVAVTPLGTPGDVHSIAELRAVLTGPIPESAWTATTPVSVDSVVAVNFSVSMGNETTVVQSTPVGSGRQSATAPAQNQLSSTYTLTQIGIRRRPRFGQDAGVWTDLLAPADSEIGSLGDLLNDPNPIVHFTSTVSFQWDADAVNDDVLDPRRLLINADSPYSFLTANPSTEEGLLATDPAFPCCAGKRSSVVHWVDFVGLPLGVRTPPVMTFTDSTSTLRWLGPRPPVVAAATGPPAGIEIARVLVPDIASYPIAVVVFDEPAVTVDINAFWPTASAAGFGSTIVVEAVRGLKVVDRQSFAMSEPAPAVIELSDTAGMTSVTVRYVRIGVPTVDQREEWLEIRNLRYRTVREERDRIADQGRCQARGGISGGGKLAWLPNHDYEIALTIRTTVDYQGSPQEAVVVQRTGFRTRGFPGLNSVESPGTELEPYVESSYPGPSGLLYRAEPVVIAFDQRFSSLLPVDRTPSPTDPAERTQLLEWVLAVEQSDGRRLSVPAADWVVAHRGTAQPPRRWVPRVVDDALVKAAVRRAPTIEPLQLRLEALEQLSPACAVNAPRLHSSQILSHSPVDPDGTDPPLWPARTTLRVAVRRKAQGPAKSAPHVSRRPFEPGDETAFTVADEGRFNATAWHVIDGMLAVSGAPAVGLRHYAVFGETDWDHAQIDAELDPAGGTAGVAVAVSGLPSVDRALLALVDETTGRLRLLARRGGATTELSNAPLPNTAAAPYALQVLVFDDKVRARVGDTSIEVDRGNMRDGRMAVVLNGSGGCSALRVDGLDGYLTQVATSRYPGFADHINSFDNVVRTLPGDAAAVGGLRASTFVEIQAAMAPNADPQIRQRLFDRWVAELAIPLSPVVAGLRLNSIGNAILVLETPEPLAFSRDVALTATHRVISQPNPPLGMPRSLMEFAAGVVFKRDAVSGAVPADAVVTVRRAHTLVHAVRSSGLTKQVEYRLYRVTVAQGPARPTLSGELVDVRATLPAVPGFPPRRLRVPVNHIALLDATGRPLAEAIPLPVERDEAIEWTILTNSVEDRALLIPTAVLQPDTYSFTFGIDRPRYRGDPTPYRSSVVAAVRIEPDAT